MSFETISNYELNRIDSNALINVEISKMEIERVKNEIRDLLYFLYDYEFFE
jgi:hypothetical protein